MNSTELDSASQTDGFKPHKILHRAINLLFRDSLHLQARTLAVSPNGITMMSPLQITRGKVCDLRFDVPLDGKFLPVQAVSRSLDCVCIGMQGFRTRLEFIQMDATSKRVLSDLMRHGA